MTEMLTSDKAICEMNTGELAEEYEYCMKSAESEALAPDLQRYFRDRAAVVKKHLDEIRAREEEELSDYCSDRDGGRYDAEVANGRGYYDASGGNSTITMYQMTSGKPGKDQGKISPWFFYFVCKILSKSDM
jgi:hypothetical protein